MILRMIGLFTALWGVTGVTASLVLDDGEGYMLMGAIFMVVGVVAFGIGEELG